MGLDAYAFAISNTCNHCNRGDKSEIGYWRNHRPLHQWMTDLYYKRGGKAGTFNCVPLELTADDLDELTKYLADFYEGDEDRFCRKQDREFIDKAKAVLDKGDKVIYDSWW